MDDNEYNRQKKGETRGGNVRDGMDRNIESQERAELTTSPRSEAICSNVTGWTLWREVGAQSTLVLMPLLTAVNKQAVIVAP